MKTKYIIVILFFLNLFRTNAQITKDISEHIGFDYTQGAYYKDTQNKLDPYVGTYVYTNGATSLKFVFKKVLSNRNNLYTEDILVGEYQYIENGIEKANTLGRFNLNYSADYVYQHSVDGNDIYDGQTYCNDCAPSEEHLYIGLVDNNAKASALFDVKKTTQNGKEAIRVIIGWSLREQKDTDPPLPNPSLPGGVYILEKQPYSNTPQSRTFTKNNCVGSEGTEETYTVLADTYSSAISVEDANNKALADIDKNGQQNSNYYGFCTFKNTPQSRTFYRNNCGAFGVSSPIDITIPAGTYISTYSQADADDQAIARLNGYDQFYINTLGTCTYSYPNNEKIGYYTKSDCNSILPGSIGQRVGYVVPSGKHKSPISIADADAKAQADIIANGQAYANSNGSCYFMSKALTNAPFRKVCIAPKVGTIVYYSAPAGLFISYTSQADADAKATAAGQANANTKGTCN